MRAGEKTVKKRATSKDLHVSLNAFKSSCSLSQERNNERVKIKQFKTSNRTYFGTVSAQIHESLVSLVSIHNWMTQKR